MFSNAQRFMEEPYERKIPMVTNGYVVKELPITTAAMSAYPFTHELDDLYTFHSEFGEIVKGGIRVGQTLWVPRESAPYAPTANDFRVTHESAPTPCVFEPRHEQGALAEQSIKLLKNGKSHIFEAPTGWGKTVVGSYVACRVGQPTLITVTKDDLMDQWRDSLITQLKIPESAIGLIQGDVCDWQGKQFVLGMTQSLMIPDRYPPEMFKAFGLLILDEVHLMAADCFVRICQTVPAKLRLGFSATPNRKDGKTQLLHWHIGHTMVKGVIVGMKPKIIVRQTGWRIPTSSKLVGNAYEQVPIPHGPGRMMLVTKAMASSQSRNMEIVNFVLQAYNSGRIVLVMSDLKEQHLHRLFQMLTNEGLPGNDIGYYVGGMSKGDLKHTKTRRVVLGTYQMCATGTDVPDWEVLVMATPRADVTQAIGRVLRWKDGKKQPIILDLVDYNSIFQGFHQARLKQYFRLGVTEVVKV